MSEDLLKDRRAVDLAHDAIRKGGIRNIQESDLRVKVIRIVESFNDETIADRARGRN
jgi:hypothetical protein